MPRTLSYGPLLAVVLAVAAAPPARTAELPATWSRLSTAGRVFGSPVVDSARNRLLVLGGGLVLPGTREDSEPQSTTSILTWDLAHDDGWRTLETTGLESGSSFFIPVLDPVNDRIYSFLGRNPVRGELWSLAFEGTPGWSKVEVQNPPFRESQLLLDPTRHWLLAVGDSAGSLRALDLDAPTRWTLLALGSPGGSVVADPEGDRLLSVHLAQAADDSCVVSEYPLPDGPWRTLAWSGIPAEAALAVNVVFDRTERRVLVSGEASDSTETRVWQLALDGTPTWSELQLDGRPPMKRDFIRIAFDPLRHRLLYLDGRSDSPGWEHLDLDALTLGPSPRFESLRPRARQFAAGALDPATGTIWMHGGLVLHDVVKGTLGDVVTTSLEDPRQWRAEVVEGDAPAPRYDHAAVFDPATRSVLFFGGADSMFASRNDTWRLRVDGSPRWEHVETIGERPYPRGGAAAVWIAERKWMVVHGGYHRGFKDAPLIDTWVLDFGADPPRWQELEPEGPILGIHGRASFIWDPRGERAILHGGGHSRYARTWALRFDVDPPLWEVLVPEDSTGGPGAWYTVTVYDPVRHRLVSSLGTNPGWNMTWNASDTTWVLPLAPGGRWRVLSTSGRSAAHEGALAFMDPDRDRVVVVGGTFNTAVEAENRRYYSFGYPSPVYGLTFDPSSREVEIPRGPVHLRLAGAHPGRGDVRIHWTAPDARPGAMELFDLRGRRLRRVPIGNDDVGSVVLIRFEDRLLAGVYFVRVSHPAGTGSLRLVYLGP